jgi:hypothetical protein
MLGPGAVGSQEKGAVISEQPAQTTTASKLPNRDLTKDIANPSASNERGLGGRPLCWSAINL